MITLKQFRGGSARKTIRRLRDGKTYAVWFVEYLNGDTPEIHIGTGSRVTDIRADRFEVVRDGHDEPTS